MKKTIRVLAFLLLLAMVAGMMPVFAIAEEESQESEKEKTISISKTVYQEGEAISVTVKGDFKDSKDWVGLYLESDTIGTGDGAVPAIHWYYAENHTTAFNIKKADEKSSRNEEEYATYKSIPAGDYKLMLLANDGYDVLDEVHFTVKAEPVPSFVLDFTEYSENTNADWGLDEKALRVEYSSIIQDGYISFKATESDPYVWIRGERADGLYEIPANELAYMVIKYRTNFDNTEGTNQGIYFYAKLVDSTTADGMSGWTSTSTPVVNDGLWHTAVVDATGVNANGMSGWGTSTENLALFRLDPLEAPEGAGIIGRETDVAYIAFFATREAAEYYAERQEVEIKTSLELSEDDPAVLTIDGQHYAAGTMQEVAEDAKTSAFRLLDEDGRDTGLTIIETDDGKEVAVDYLIPLTYRSAADSALTVGEKVYIFDSKLAVTAQYDYTYPDDNSVVSDKLADIPNVPTMSADTLFYDDVVQKDGGAPGYIADTLGGMVASIDGEYSTISFRGWAKTQDAADAKITAYGYSLNDGEIVWDEDWITDGSDVVGTIGGNVTRYKINVDTTTLENGVYQVYLFVKDAQGGIYRQNGWNDFKMAIGGSKTLTGYTDADGKEYDADAIVWTDEQTRQAYLLQGAVDITNGLPEDAKGMYYYDGSDAETRVTYIKAPSHSVKPEEAVPVYILDGENLNTLSPKDTEDAVYDYEKGCIRYTALNGDPNAGSNQIPAGTKVAPYMVVRYRTEVDCKGEVFVGTGAGASGGSNVPFPSAYLSDGKWHYLIVDLRQSSDYNATTNIINHFRNDYAQEKDNWVEIAYYAFFDTYEQAEYYASHDLHEAPVDTKLTATFVDEDGTVIKVIEFEAGDQRLSGIPKPPSKEGYLSAWESYTLGNESITIHVVYTAIETSTGGEDESSSETEPGSESSSESEPESEPSSESESVSESESASEPASEPTSESSSESESVSATESGTDAATDKATDTNAAASSGTEGCASVVGAGAAALILTAMAAAVAVKKRKL